MVRETKTSSEKLGNRIVCLKYTIFSFNVIAWMVGASVFALCIWMKVEPSFSDWITRLQLTKIYKGLYVLLAASIIVMIVSFAGCCATLLESTAGLIMFVASQAVGFILNLAGAAVLLDYSTTDSKLPPMIRDRMRRIIMDSYNPESIETLRLIQESIGCCGADGPQDYLTMHKELPSECRDTVTGNAYFYGCSQEITWFFEEKCAWISALALVLCALQMLNIVMCTILMQAFKKEENEYRYDPPSRM